MKIEQCMIDALRVSNNLLREGMTTAEAERDSARSKLEAAERLAKERAEKAEGELALSETLKGNAEAEFKRLRDRIENLPRHAVYSGRFHIEDKIDANGEFCMYADIHALLDNAKGGGCGIDTPPCAECGGLAGGHFGSCPQGSEY